MIDTPHQGIGSQAAGVASELDIALRGKTSSGSCVTDPLTARERDVLTMISEGLSNKCIARALQISPETVKSHVKHIFMKLEVTTRTQAVVRAASRELL